MTDTYEALAYASVSETLLALAKDYGITDAWCMNPGPGTVHIDVPSGTAYLSDNEGGIPCTGAPGFTVGYTYLDGTAETLAWADFDPQRPGDLSVPIRKLAEAALAARGGTPWPSV